MPRRAAEPRQPLPSPGAMALLGIWALLLLLAPPRSNWFWGVNGFRSVVPAARLALIAAAAAAFAWSRARAPSRAMSAALAIALAATLAFALCERIHFLGDTGVRIGALTLYEQGIARPPLPDWGRQLHAAPLDLLVSCLLPVAIGSLGFGVEAGVRVTGFALGIIFLFFAARVASRLAGREESGQPRRHLLAAALIVNGTLLAFAGYAESAAIQLAAAALWWSLLLAPLRSTRGALASAAGWLVVVLAHRIGILWLPVLVWRAFGPPLEGDAPAPRLVLRWASPVAAALALALVLLTRETGQLGYDFGEIFAALKRPGGWGGPLADAANLLAVIAPLAILAPAVGDGGAVRAAAKSPRAGGILLAALPLLPLAIVLPLVPSWMGGQREWDANVLLGWTLSLAATAALAALPRARLRTALGWTLPLLVLGAGGWIGVNADERASVARAVALAEQPPPLADGQRAAIDLYLGRLAASRGRPAEAARYLERSYDLAPTPNRGLLAAKAWGEAGDLQALHRMVARVRDRGGLDAAASEAADTLEAQAARLEAVRR
jgi:hypothetical protein